LLRVTYEKITEKKERGVVMSISRLTKILMVLFVIFALLSILFNLGSWQSNRSLDSALDDKFNFVQTSQEFRNSVANLAIWIRDEVSKARASERYIFPEEEYNMNLLGLEISILNELNLHQDEYNMVQNTFELHYNFAEIVEMAVSYLREINQNAFNALNAEDIVFSVEFNDAMDDLLQSLDRLHEAVETRSEQTVDKRRRESNIFQIVAIATSILLAIVSVAGVFFIGRKIKPLKELVEIVDNVSKGNMNINIKNTKTSKDEVGELTNDIYTLVGKIKGIIKTTESLGNNISNGNLGVKGDYGSYEGAYRELIKSVNKVSESAKLYLDNIDGSVFIVSPKDYRCRYFNKYVLERDNVKETMLDGKFLKEKYVEFFEEVTRTGKQLEQSLVGISHDERTILMDYSYLPIKDSSGDVNSLMLIGTEITELVRTENVAKKIQRYQEDESRKLSDKLNSGLAQGKLQFDYQVETPDSDTSGAANTYDLIADTLKKALDTIKGYVQEVDDVLKRIANGSLTETIHRNYMGDFVSTKDSINYISNSLHTTITKIFSVAEQVLAGANQVSNSAAVLSESVSKQADSIRELNYNVDLISEQSRQNAEITSEVNVLSNKSKEHVQEGQNAIIDMLEAMTQIKQSSGDISKIIKTIEDIAFQTNILAVNASIEAAHAGQSGVGFAVVADEVRKLAERSSEAASDITALIGNSIKRIDEGNSIATATATALDSIATNTRDVSNRVNVIATSSQTQEDAIGLVVDKLNEISSAGQDNSAMSEEIAATSQELNSQAEGLQELVSYFKL